MERVAPVFAAGETEPVIRYARESLPLMADRLGLSPADKARLCELFMAALTANAARMDTVLNAPFVEPLPESRELVTLLGNLLVGDVDHSGLEHVGAALEFMAQGGNVLFVSNHTSGADTLVLDHVVNTAFPKATYPWLWMAGHVVNLYLLPLAICGGLHRIQIFSSKYSAAAAPEIQRDMRTRNVQALMSIAPLVMQGGACIGLYPEGGRGNGGLLAGDPKTVKIPELMATASPAGLMILPSYVEATDILPVVRGENEFNEFLAYGRRGSATLRFGAPVAWDNLQPTREEVQEYLDHNPLQCAGRADLALKQCIHGKIMRSIAALAPESARGVWA